VVKIFAFLDLVKNLSFSDSLIVAGIFLFPLYGFFDILIHFELSDPALSITR